MLVGGQAYAQTPAAKTPWSEQTTDVAEQRKWFTDLRLLDQDGREVKFYSDVLKDKVVLIDFIFTHCQDSCPVLTRIFYGVQELLGSRMGKDVFLVSISVDPERDRPAVLKKFAAEYRAKAGWTFLTGPKEKIEWVTYKLGQWSEKVEAHSPLMMIANVKAGRWQVVRGDATPQQLVAMLDRIRAP